VNLPPTGLDPSWEVLERKSNAFQSTFPTEILTCRRPDGHVFRVLLKPSAGLEHDCEGHRGGVAYESRVYREVLAHTEISCPRFLSSFTDDGETCLAIEFVEDAVSAECAPDPILAMEHAARWSARFQRAVPASTYGYLTRYDGAYYAQWVTRTWEFAGAWQGRLDWLKPLIGSAEPYLRGFEQRLSLPIHGEFTPHNVLVRGDPTHPAVYPVDWESAAIGLPEIDVVCLTDKWPPEYSERCLAAYVDERFGADRPSDWDSRVDRARLYLNFRWLGDRPEWTGLDKVGPRFEQLRAAAERLELL